MEPKFVEETRSTRALSYTMIMLNVANVMERCDKENAEKYRAAADGFIQDLIKYFYKEDLKACLENGWGKRRVFA